MTPRRRHEDDPALMNSSLTAGTTVLPFRHAHYLSRLSLMRVLDAANRTLLLSSQASGTRRFRADGVLEWVSLWLQRDGEAQKETASGNSL